MKNKKYSPHPLPLSTWRGALCHSVTTTLAGVRFSFLLFLAFTACSNNPSTTTEAQAPAPAAKQIQIPDFNADSAYNITKAQVDFGPRMPNTKQHDACGRYIISEIKQYCKDVTIQKCDVKGYDGTILHSENIIANFYPE